MFQWIKGLKLVRTALIGEQGGGGQGGFYPV